MEIRKAVPEDLGGLLALYSQFSKNALTDKDERAAEIWRSILRTGITISPSPSWTAVLCPPVCW
jgi:phage portal protein BeeE